MNIQYHTSHRERQLIRDLKGYISTLKDALALAEKRLEQGLLPNSAGIVQGQGSKIDMIVAALHEIEDITQITGDIGDE